MIGWKRTAHIPARRSRRKPIALHLERLEDRVLLDATSSGQAASTLLVDLSHLRNDLATSALTLVTTPPSNAYQWNKVWSVLTTDWQQTQRAFVQFEYAELKAVDDWLDTVLGIPNQQQGSPPPSAPPPSVQPPGDQNTGLPIVAHPLSPPPPPPLPYVSLLTGSNLQVQESSSGAYVEAGLSAVTDHDVTVQFTVSNGTAGAGKDYGTTSGSITIPAGSGQANSHITILDDNAVNEPTETFTVTLSNPSGATFGPGPTSGTYTIREDSDGGTHLPPPSVAKCFCNCGDPNEPGALDAVYDYPPKKLFVPSDSSDAPVRYADGVVTLAETDLHSDGFGFPWGQTRSWTNGPGYATGGYCQ
jgi:hypothetical protein